MTQEEAVELDKFLTRMEKRNRGWWLIRWLTLPAGLVMLALGVATMKVGIDAIPALPADKPTAAVSALDLYSANLSAMNSCMALVVAIVHTSVGILVVIFTLAHWRRDRRDRLLVKLARSCLAILVPVR